MSLRLHLTGGGERPDTGDSRHLQRAARLPRLLAHLQHHGRQPVHGQIRNVPGRRRSSPTAEQHVEHNEQGHVPTEGKGRTQRLLVSPGHQLRQRPRRLSGSIPSGERPCSTRLASTVTPTSQKNK